MPNPLETLRQRNEARAAGATPAPLSNGAKGGIAATIAAILVGIYAAEGGYVNDKHDRGGATNYGVTEAVARQNGYVGDMRNFPKHCYGDVTVCADKIYVERYIVAPGYYPLLSIEPAVAEELIDTGVNMGPRWPSIWFQSSINVFCGTKLAPDGKVGPKTIAAYESCATQKGSVALCKMMLDSLDRSQEARYRRIVANNPSQAKFLRGWLRLRVGNVNPQSCGKGNPQ